MATKEATCVGRGTNKEFGINIYTLQYIQKITNRDLMYSASSTSQYYVIIYIKNESKKEWIYVHAYVYITK